MKYLYLLIICNILCIISCSQSTTLQLEEDEALQEVYSLEELTNLTKIVNFFDSYVKKQTAEKSICKAYHVFFSSLKSIQSQEDLKSRIDKTASKNLNNMIKSLINSGIFNEIWIYEYGYDYNTKDTLKVAIAPNVKGKHFKLLQLLGEDKEYLDEYSNNILACSCIPPTMVLGFYNVHDNINFNKEVNRLIWAIHFITTVSEKDYSKNCNYYEIPF